MPLIASRAGGSARGFGWAVSDLGGGSWILNLNADAGSYFISATSDNSLNSYQTLQRASGGSVPTLIKINPNGTIAWQYSTNATITGGVLGGIGVDSSGNIYWGAYRNDGGPQESYIFKLNSSGAVTAQRTYNFNEGNSFVGRAIAIKPNGTGIVLATTDGFSAYGPMAIAFDTSLNAGTQFSWSITPQNYGILILDNNTAITSVGNNMMATNFSSVLWAFDSQFGNYIGPVATNANNELYSISTSQTGNGLAIGRITPSTGASVWTNRLTSLADIALGGCAANNSFVYGLFAADSGNRSIYINKRSTSDGTLQWQRRISISGTTMGFVDQSQSGGQVVSVDADDKFFYVTLQVANNATKSWTWKLPADGSKTGTYSFGGYSWVYASTSLSNSSSSYSAVTRSTTAATRTRPTGTPTYTFPASSITESKFTIP